MNIVAKQLQRRPIVPRPSALRQAVVSQALSGRPMVDMIAMQDHLKVSQPIDLVLRRSMTRYGFGIKEGLRYFYLPCYVRSQPVDADSISFFLMI